MLNKSAKRLLYMALCIGLLLSIASAQTTVYNNFGPDHGGWDYNYGLGWTVAGVNVAVQYGVEQAMGFTSTADGVVSDIWVAFFYVPSSTSPDSVTIKLCRNPNGLPPEPEDVMEEWLITEFYDWYQWDPPHHLVGSGSSSLEEGDSYWLWAVGGETTWTGWCMNIDPILTCPHTLRREGEDWLSISYETAAAFRVDVETEQPLELILTPATSPVQVPSFGGTFDFNVAVSNNSISPETVDFWTMVTLPDGSEYGPLMLVEQFTIAAGLALERDRTQIVPGAAPAGNYTYDAYLGEYPISVLCEDHFDWEKLGTNGDSQMGGDWFCYGEPFEDELGDEPDLFPDQSVLVQAYPNPFNPVTTLSFTVPTAAKIRLAVYDQTGAEVATLVDGWRDQGLHEVSFDATHIASGIYFARLAAGLFTQTQKLVLLK